MAFSLIPTTKNLYAYGERLKLLFGLQPESGTYRAKIPLDQMTNVTDTQYNHVTAAILTDGKILICGSKKLFKQDCMETGTDDEIMGRFGQIDFDLPVTNFCLGINAIIINSQGSLWGSSMWGSLFDINVLPKTFAPIIFPHFVTKVRCGSDFVILMTDEGLFGGGSNFYGQLGLTNEDIPHLNQFVKIPSIGEFVTENVTDISCGYDYTFVLSDNKLFSFGNNQRGQLGFDNCRSIPVPTRVLVEHEIIDFSCGDNHTVVLTNLGLYTTNNSLSYTNLDPIPGFKKIIFDKPVNKVIAHKNYTLIDSNGDLYISTGNQLSIMMGIRPQSAQFSHVPLEGNFVTHKQENRRFKNTKRSN